MGGNNSDAPADGGKTATSGSFDEYLLYDQIGHIRKKRQSVVPSFAPSNPLDGRSPGDWGTRYPKIARRRIRYEAIYVVLILVLCSASSLALSLYSDRLAQPLGVQPGRMELVVPFVVAGLGGIIGGSLFTMKWLYHSVAKQTWNADRTLWRVFTPILSGGIALTVFTLAASRVLPLFGNEITATAEGAFGVSLLVGYFSDKAISRLERLANQHLGGRGGSK